MLFANIVAFNTVCRTKTLYVNLCTVCYKIMLFYLSVDRLIWRVNIRLRSLFNEWKSSEMAVKKYWIKGQHWRRNIAVQIYLRKAYVGSLIISVLWKILKQTLQRMSIDRKIPDQNIKWKRSLTTDFKYLHFFFNSRKMSLRIQNLMLKRLFIYVKNVSNWIILW